MRPELYRLLKVARQVGTLDESGPSLYTNGKLVQALQAANAGPSSSRTQQAPDPTHGLDTTTSPSPVANEDPSRSQKRQAQAIRRAEALMRRLHTTPVPSPAANKGLSSSQTQQAKALMRGLDTTTSPTSASETTSPPAAVEPPRTWHDAYQRRRAALRRQVRKGNMSTWQAQKNMQHWRETNLPGQNDQPLGVPGGSTQPTTQGFKYMLRQMAPTNTNAQNLREIRKAYNTATPQMRQTMFNNAQAAWRAGYTGPALTLEQLQSSNGFQS